MKKAIIYASVLVALGISACQNKSNEQGNDKSDSALAALPKTQVEFEETKFDFGKLTQGAEAKHIYRFHNTGQNPLTINKVTPSCGCTVPKYSSEPVAPGAWGEIDVVFNTKNKEGMQSKSVTVETNTEPSITVLQFTAEILTKETTKVENK